jgi:hypothetical protein
MSDRNNCARLGEYPIAFASPAAVPSGVTTVVSTLTLSKLAVAFPDE